MAIFAAYHTKTMVEKNIYRSLVSAKERREKKLVVLIDPDKMRLHNMERVLEVSVEARVDYFFIGGSLIVNNMLEQCIQHIKDYCDIPAVLFPGNSFQLSYRADGILFLSLISGRNAELLIGKHVITAPYLKESPLEVIPTGYMLIDGGIPTTVSYMSNTRPIPNSKDDVALCTAMAGEMLGMKLIYLDAGSGAERPISTSMIEAVSNTISVPLIVGGGIRTPERALANIEAGADILVVGNAIEHNPTLIHELAQAVHSLDPRPATPAPGNHLPEAT
jgi:putative glycerol-1-phosphate prenyltransferase